MMVASTRVGRCAGSGWTVVTVLAAIALLVSGCGASDEVRAQRAGTEGAFDAGSVSSASGAGAATGAGEAIAAGPEAAALGDVGAAAQVSDGGDAPSGDDAGAPAPGVPAPSAPSADAAGANFEDPARGVTKDSLRVAAWYFLSGAAADTLPDPLKLWQAAVKFYNDQGGVNGRSYVPNPTDSDLNCGMGVANVRKAIESDKVFAFAGGFNPYMSSCIGPVLDEYKVPAIITDGIDPAILNHEYVFPVGTTHYRYTRLALLWAKEKMGASTAIAVTHSDGTFDTVVNGAREVMGDGLIGVERIAYDEGNMAPLVQRMASKNPEAIYFYVNPDRLIIILQEMERQGFKPSKGIVGGVSLFLNLIPDSVGEFAEGMVANSWVAVVGSPSPGVKEMQAAVDRYEPGTAIDGYSAGGYAAFRLFHNVVKSLGREVTRERLVEAMYSLRNFDNAGLQPPLTFTREDREANRGTQWVQVQEGKFQYIHDWTFDE